MHGVRGGRRGGNADARFGLLWWTRRRSHALDAEEVRQAGQRGVLSYRKRTRAEPLEGRTERRHQKETPRIGCILRSGHSARIQDGVTMTKLAKPFNPPPGYEGGEPRIEVTTTQTFYPKPPKQRKIPSPAVSKQEPMPVKIVDVTRVAAKKVKDFSRGYRVVK